MNSQGLHKGKGVILGWCYTKVTPRVNGKVTVRVNSQCKVKGIIKETDKNTLYFKYGGREKNTANQAVALTPTKETIQLNSLKENKSNNPTDTVLPKTERETNLKEWHKDSHLLTKNADGSLNFD